MADTICCVAITNSDEDWLQLHFAFISVFLIFDCVLVHRTAMSLLSCMKRRSCYVPLRLYGIVGRQVEYSVCWHLFCKQNILNETNAFRRNCLQLFMSRSYKHELQSELNNDNTDWVSHEQQFKRNKKLHILDSQTLKPESFDTIQCTFDYLFTMCWNWDYCVFHFLVLFTIVCFHSFFISDYFFIRMHFADYW